MSVNESTETPNERQGTHRSGVVDHESMRGLYAAPTIRVTLPAQSAFQKLRTISFFDSHEHLDLLTLRRLEISELSFFKKSCSIVRAGEYSSPTFIRCPHQPRHPARVVSVSKSEFKLLKFRALTFKVHLS